MQLFYSQCAGHVIPGILLCMYQYCSKEIQKAILYFTSHCAESSTETTHCNISFSWVYNHLLLSQILQMLQAIFVSREERVP